VNPERKIGEDAGAVGSTPWQAEARRLVRQRLAAEPGRVAALWAEVEAEAWQEVRALLKAEMVAAVLAELDRQGAGETGNCGAGAAVAPASERAARGHDEPDVSPTAAPSRRSPDERSHQDTAPAAPSAVGPEQPAIGEAQAGLPTPQTGTGLYVYGVVDRTELAGLPEDGVAAGYPVTLLPYRDLAAVVSAVPLAEWGEEPLKANLGNMAWLEASVRSHQAVLDTVLPLASLIPMKFATVYLAPAGVEAFLTEHYAAFLALLGELRGRQEWGLKLYCDDALLAARIAEISPEVARLRAEIASKPKGAAYLLARKLQEVSDQEGERIEMAVADRTHTALSRCSAAAGLNPLQSSEITGRSERMLLNAAYLVDVTAFDAFQSALAEVAAGYSSHGFQFELSGPWPAYNFAALPAGEPGNLPTSSGTPET